MEAKVEPYLGPPLSSISMPVIPLVFQAEVDSATAAVLHKVLRSRGHADPAAVLHGLAMRYRKNFDTIFPTPLREVYEPNFFTLDNLRKIPAQSPTMFAIYSIVGCITCGMSVEMADDIWGAALKLVAKFSTPDPQWTPRETLLVADTFNRIATYFGAIGSLEKARSYLGYATSTLNMLSNAAHDPQCKPIYESLLWTRSTYTIDFDQLKEAFEWAKDSKRMNAQIYSTFAFTVFLCYPDIKRDPTELGFRPSDCVIQLSQVKPTLAVVAQLRELLIQAGYASVKDGRRTYHALFEASFGALEAWINSNYIEATKRIGATVVPSALLSNPQIEVYIPLYFAAFVSLQLAKYDQVQMLDYAELHLRQLMKINIMRWARNLLDHLIFRLELLCGEPTNLTWSELTKENCAQYGLCTGVSVDVSESPNPEDDAARPINSQ